MRRTLSLSRLLPRASIRFQSTHSAPPPVVRIDNGTFYRRQPSSATSDPDSANPPIFPSLTFDIPSRNPRNEYWAIVGPSNAGKTTILDILRGQHLCFPPNARTFPYLSTEEVEKKDPRLRFAGNAIQYVGFDNKQRGLSGMGTYMAARYESRKEATDFSVSDYLKGRTQLNASETEGEKLDQPALEKVTADLRLGQLLDMPLSYLSNGQTRRARIARALLGRPEVLLLDEPFMGLDPQTTIQLSSLLRSLAHSNDPRLLLALRPQDAVPDWITHVLFLGEDLCITHRGTVRDVKKALADATADPQHKADGSDDSHINMPRSHHEFGRHILTDKGVELELNDLTNFRRGIMSSARRKFEKGDRSPKTLQDVSDVSVLNPAKNHAPLDPGPSIGEPVIEMDGVVVKYGEKVVLGKGRQVDNGTLREEEGLFWHVHRGQRWGVFGPNGSGKTTLLSLLTSDHPQSYALPLKLFSRPRLPRPGHPSIPLFELQRRIGHSSPETHSFFPRHLSVRSTLESAFAATPLSRPTSLTTAADERVSAFLRWFQAEINPSAGLNPVLAEEYFREVKNPRKDYAVPADAATYRERYNAHWYDVSQAAEESVAWAESMTFRDCSFSAQRVLLFLRAIVARPDVVVLDEAFSGLDDWVRDKCILFLEHGEGRRLTPWSLKNHVEFRGTLGGELGGFKSVERGRRETRDSVFWGLGGEQALVCVSHVKEEVPGVVRDWLFLPDLTGQQGEGDGEVQQVRRGRVEKRVLRLDGGLWNHIWGLDR